MKKPDFTQSQIEWVSEEIIGDEEEISIANNTSQSQWGLSLLDNIKREIRNELRREQERKLRDI